MYLAAVLRTCQLFDTFHFFFNSHCRCFQVREYVYTRVSFPSRDEGAGVERPNELRLPRPGKHDNSVYT